MRLRSVEARCFICSFLISLTTTVEADDANDVDDDLFGFASVFVSSSSSSSSEAAPFFLDDFDLDEDFEADFDFDDDDDDDDDLDGVLPRTTALLDDFLPLLPFDVLLEFEDFLLPLDFFFEDAAKAVF